MKQQNSQELAEHLFRIEYGRIVSVITSVFGIANLKIAEDITQETFLKAVKYWQHNGIPPNPKAWLYVAAKNEAINVLKKRRKEINYRHENQDSIFSEIESLSFSDHTISDGQLKMMFVCCNPLLSGQSQISLILKTLCGFSITEIASAFMTSKEVINKRLVRARRKLKVNNISFDLPLNLETQVPVILKALYLLFNEGYSPAEKNILIRKELCFEAIRLAEILKSSTELPDSDHCHALLSLMYFNASRFKARINESNELIEMRNQDRGLWDERLINEGIVNLDKAFENRSISTYHILAAISANYCVASAYEETNWSEILSLYDSFLTMEDSPLARLNRSVVLAKVKGNLFAINELNELAENTNVEELHLFHSTIAEFYTQESNFDMAARHLNIAIAKAVNQRDIKLLKKKLNEVVLV